MKQLLLILACLLASGLSSANAEGEDCPAACSCTEEGVGPFIARCSTLDPAQKFGRKISRLVIENDNAIVLDRNTFEIVGLENVSTIKIINSTFKKLDTTAFSGLNLLGTIELVSLKQLVLDPDMFTETPSLSQLVIRDSDLKFSRKSDYLFDIPLLRELILSNCGITELHPEAFSKMSKLQSVNLAFNKLKSLGKEFVSLSELEEVDLSHNLLGEVGPDVFEHKDLDVLRLRGNLLTSMAGVQLPGLIELDVSLCKFTKIDKDTFSGFSRIQILNLSGNALSEIAEDSFGDESLSTLTHLDLSNNALQGPLPEGLFQKVSDLRILSLAHNPKLQVLPDKIFQGLRYLFRLDMSVCGLKALEGSLFEDLERLTYLNLARNDLNRLKPGLLNKYITNLDLSHNKIENLEDIKFASDSRLRKLNLAGNKLEDLETDPLADLLLLETLDLSSCSLSSLWESEDAPALESLQTLSIAQNYINIITEKQLALTPNLMGVDISGNPLECDDTFTTTLKWFKDHKVRPNTVKLETKLQSLAREDSYSEDVSPIGWGEVEEQMCGEREKEPLEQETNEDSKLDDPEDDPEDDDGEDDADYDESGEDADYEGNEDDMFPAPSPATPSNNSKDNGLDGLDNIVWRESTILAESNDNYLWSVIIVLFSVVAILFSLTILAACVLRWSRQRNSYGARMINTHLHPPGMKRGRSSIYQQLYEDPNHPTTPIMSMKHSDQTQYNFPEMQGGKQFGYITYLSKDFHDSTVIPESV